MTTWFSGHGWSWCGAMVDIPAMAVLWGALLTAFVLALRSAFTRPSDPVTPTGNGTAWRGGSAADAHTTRSEIDDDDFYRRLM